MLYSAKSNAFFPAELVPAYEAAGTLPDDAKEVPDAIVDEYYRTVAPEGKIMVAGEDGLPTWAAAPSLSLQQIEEAKIFLVQGHLDATARMHRYDNMVTACTYADEPAVPSYQSEGRALRAWRSLVWERAHRILEDARNGLREMPEDDVMISELPPFR